MIDIGVLLAVLLVAGVLLGIVSWALHDAVMDASSSRDSFRKQNDRLQSKLDRIRAILDEPEDTGE